MSDSKWRATRRRRRRATKARERQLVLNNEKEQLLLLLLLQPDGTTRVCTGVGRGINFCPCPQGFTWSKNCHCKFFFTKNKIKFVVIPGEYKVCALPFAPMRQKGACELLSSWVFVCVVEVGFGGGEGYVASHSLLVIDT
jgi:hypothetical protein